MPSTVQSVVRTAYELAFSGSPILLTGGIASAIPGGTLPIIVILNALTTGANLLTAAAGQNSVSAALTQFATFEPLAGSNLISTQIASYPFASQAVAANAAITTPLSVALRMVVPAQGAGGYTLKTATMIALKTALDAHIQAGGLFTVLTPSYFYEGCILLDLRDNTSGAGTQKQVEWVWSFQMPLTQEQQLTQVLNNLMSKISGGLPNNNTWSSISTAVGGATGSIGSGLSSIGTSVGSALGV
jgi:hypothetical protein